MRREGIKIVEEHGMEPPKSRYGYHKVKTKTFKKVERKLEQIKSRPVKKFDFEAFKEERDERLRREKAVRLVKKANLPMHYRKDAVSFVEGLLAIRDVTKDDIQEWLERRISVSRKCNNYYVDEK